MIETDQNKPKNRNEPEEGQRAHICLVLIGCFNKSTKNDPARQNDLMPLRTQNDTGPAISASRRKYKERTRTNNQSKRN